MRQALPLLALVALLLLAAVLPTASATPPAPPVESEATLDGDPRVGEEVGLTVRLTFHMAAEGTVRLLTSGNVTVLDDPAWSLDASEDSVHERTFRLRVDGPGLWAAGLERAYHDGMTWPSDRCCVYAYAVQGAGAWTDHPEAAFREQLPEVGAEPALSARALGPQEVELRYDVELTGPMAEHLRVQERVGQGSVVAPYDRRAVRAGAGPVATFALADGEHRQVNAWSEWTAAWPLPAGVEAANQTLAPAGVSGEAHCVNVELSRNGDTVNMVRSPCGGWSGETGSSAQVPGVGWLGAVGVVAMAGLVGRRRSG